MATARRRVLLILNIVPLRLELVMYESCEKFSHVDAHGLCASQLCAAEFLAEAGALTPEAVA